MIKPERSTYTPIDFREWRDSEMLQISPKFQRRGVWTQPARSYLIDTLLLGMPVPPIYLRITQTPARDKILREVIDGQQRISAVLDYLDDTFPLAKNIETQWAQYKFSDLPQSEQHTILSYPFTCDVFYGIDDTDVLRIFARMNTHSVRLNAQELRNGRFFGPFKQTAYQLALEHLQFWRDNRIFTERGIARMSEVELTSELIIIQLGGLQDKKSSINDYYEYYDESFKTRRKVIDRFTHTIDEISSSVGRILPATAFRRPPLFYSLYAATYHRLYGVAGLDLPNGSKSKLSTADRTSLEGAVRKLSDLVRAAQNDESTPKRYGTFIASCLRQTDNLRPRQTRTFTLYKEAFTK